MSEKKKEKPETKLCPLLLMAWSVRSSEQIKRCREEKCAWYLKREGEKRGACSILHIASKLSILTPSLMK